MNCKAQLGSVIANFPVIISLFLIMTIFVFIASSNAFIKKPNEVESKELSLEKNRLFEFQKVTLDSEQKELMILEILQMYIRKEISLDQTEKMFSEFLTNKNVSNECLIIFHNSEIIYLYYQTNGENSKVFTTKELDLRTITDTYEKLNVFRYINLNNDKQEVKKIKYYFGNCLTKPQR